MSTNILKSTDNDGITRHETGDIFNLTQLTVDKELQRFRAQHRDFLGHFFRYVHTAKIAFTMKAPAILDVGCGVSWHQLTALHSNGCHPSLYFAIDARDCADKMPKVNFSTQFQQMNIVEGLPNNPNNIPWNLIVCYEVLEHLSKENGQKLIANIASVMNENTLLLFSTPCFDERSGQAQNHIYEWKFEELQEELEKIFVIDDAFGVFASQRDYKEELAASPELSAAVEIWKKYFNSALLSCLMAPLFPDKARNCLWHLRKKPTTI